MEGKSRMFFRLLFKSLSVQKSRVAITFFSVVIGAAVITSLSCVYFDISIKIRQELRAYGANFFVAPKVDSVERTLDEPLIEQVVGEIPPQDIVGWSPYLYGIVRLDLGNAVMAGVDFPGLIKLSPFWQVEGKWVSMAFDEIHCMVGTALAKSMEIHLGDEVSVTNRETGIYKKLKVRGIIETGGAEDKQLFVNMSLAQKVLAREQKIHHAKFSLTSENADINALAETLKHKFGLIDAKPLRKLSYSEGKILDKITGIMSLVSLMILIATFFGVMTTLIAIIAERSKEIGLMKSLGADNRSVILQFLSETALITLSGTLVGIGLGFILAQILGQSVFGSAISFRPLVLPLVLGISLSTGLLAALVPVRMAIRISPAQVLRGE